MKKAAATEQEPIVLLIDGTCYLCHGITRFVVKRDPSRRFRFANLQSPAGQRMLELKGLTNPLPDSFVMIQQRNCYIKSEAALHVFRELGGLWRLLYGGIVLPAVVRDWVYDQIAKRRYRWFGQSEVCLMPTADLRSRFIEAVDEVKLDEG